jgi:NADP-dependent 3-hydroxy acid dehydrogenase YdfG
VEAIRENGGEAAAAQADVSSYADVEALMASIQREYGGIDILVNNAGIMPPLVAVDEMDAAAVDTTIAVNLTASITLTRLVVPGMRTRGRGHIFFTGSTAGHAPFPRMAVYSATKAAIAAFADGLRLDVAPYRVKVTEIVAGRTETNLYSTLLSDEMRAAMYADGTAVQPRHAGMVLAVLALPRRQTWRGSISSPPGKRLQPAP